VTVNGLMRNPHPLVVGILVAAEAPAHLLWRPTLFELIQHSAHQARITRLVPQPLLLPSSPILHVGPMRVVAAAVAVAPQLPQNGAGSPAQRTGNLARARAKPLHSFDHHALRTVKMVVGHRETSGLL